MSFHELLLTIISYHQVRKKPKKKSSKPKAKAREFQAELDKATEEINRLKADLEKKEKAKQDAEIKAKQAQKQAAKEKEDKLMALAAAEQKVDQVNTTEATKPADAVSVPKPANEPPAISSTPQAKKGSKKKLKEKDGQHQFPEEGVVCVQELQMGEKHQVRSAVGVGNEVWTIDWGGMVSENTTLSFLQRGVILLTKW